MTTVLVTRPAQQAEGLCQLLEQQDMTVVRLPLLEIQPLERLQAGLQKFNYSPAVNWLIFISVNAVNFALAANNGKIPANFLQAKIAAVGQATMQALQQFGVAVNIVPEQGFNSEALLALPELQQLQGQRCVIVRGLGGRELLAETLEVRGAQVEYWEVYRRQMPVTDPAMLMNLLRTQLLDVITVTSAEILQNLLALLPTQPERSYLLACPLVVISARLDVMAHDLGFSKVAVADGVSDHAVFKTIINLVSGEDSG